MKILGVFLFSIVSLFAYVFGLLNPAQGSKNTVVVMGATPKTDSCLELDYRHKSEVELASMTPTQLIDEGVKEQLYHMPSFDEYGGALISKYVRKAGVKILPILIEYANAYNPKSASKCEEMRFFVASGELSGLDRGLIRLRGIKGRSISDRCSRACTRENERGRF